MKRLTFFLSILGLVFLIQCSFDDFANTPGTRDFEIDSVTDPDFSATNLQGNVNVDITLDLARSPWKLTGPLSVKSGVTLTIEPGVIIEAEAGGGDVYLVVETGARIDAQGTAANPIRFTSSSPTPGNGDWGGILINGLAPISGGGTSITEVVPLIYGGTDPADNSGVFEYVIIEYTGARINGEKEFNGLTLYAVGSATEINNIVINGGDDDGIEFFGGTVEVDNLLVINAKDDMFDWTQGYTGGGENWYGIREAGYTDQSDDPRGIEADGNLDGLNPTQSGQSNPTIDKLTIVNGEAEVEIADMVKIRRGSGATLTNVMLALTEDGGSYGSYSDMIDFSDSKGMANDATTVSVWYNNHLVANEDETDIKMQADFDNPEDGIQSDEMTSATVTTTSGATGADTSVFSWAGITLPTLTPHVNP